MLLTLLAILCGGALVIATGVFLAAALRHWSGEDLREENEALQSDLSPYRNDWVPRKKTDRRRNPNPNIFPITVNGVRVDQDRRVNPDRRKVA